MCSVELRTELCNFCHDGLAGICVGVIWLAKVISILNLLSKKIAGFFRNNMDCQGIFLCCFYANPQSSLKE